MQANLGDLLILSLAVWQAVEVWHHSKLFASRRAAIQGWLHWSHFGFRMMYVVRREDRQKGRTPSSRRLFGLMRHWTNAWFWLRELLECPWCTSVWVGFILSAAWFCLPVWLWWLNLFTMGLAASRAANALNDLTYDHCRTPRSDRTIEDQEEDES